jgi:hypothetical protein
MKVYWGVKVQLHSFFDLGTRWRWEKSENCGSSDWAMLSISVWVHFVPKCHSQHFVLTQTMFVLPSEWTLIFTTIYEGVSKSFRTDRLERELQMVQLSATRCNCIAILWVSLVNFAIITLCVASQRDFVVIRVYFVIDLVRKLLDTPSYKSRSLPLNKPSVRATLIYR